MRYKGTYRVKAHVDESTNDFPRDTDGKLDTDDLYIKCANGSQIYHYGHAILVAYVPSIGRGHNILRALGEELIGVKAENKIPYDELYSKLLKEGTIREIRETDEEIEFKFHSKNIELIAKYLKPQTSGSSISPFSTKNLPKSDYTIPVEDLEEYREITVDISKDDILIISQITRSFLTVQLPKNKAYKSKDIKADMKLKKLKGKEYIHSIGMWSEYLNYLKKEISTWKECLNLKK